MFKYFFIFIFLISFTNSHAENKDKIIEKLQNTKNLVFEFEQNINYIIIFQNSEIYISLV